MLDPRTQAGPRRSRQHVSVPSDGRKRLAVGGLHPVGHNDRNPVPRGQQVLGPNDQRRVFVGNRVRGIQLGKRQDGGTSGEIPDLNRSPQLRLRWTGKRRSIDGDI